MRGGGGEDIESTGKGEERSERNREGGGEKRMERIREWGQKRNRQRGERKRKRSEERWMGGERGGNR